VNDLERHAHSWRGRLIEDTEQRQIGLVVQGRAREGRVLLAVRFPGEEREEREIAVREISDPYTGGDELVREDPHSRYRPVSREYVRRRYGAREDSGATGGDFALAVSLRARGPAHTAVKMLADQLKAELCEIFDDVRGAKVTVWPGEIELNPGDDTVVLRVDGIITAPARAVADRADEITSCVSSLLEDQPERWARLRQARFRTSDGGFNFVATLAGRRVELDGDVHFG
jgi:hypothetical protein